MKEWFRKRQILMHVNLLKEFRHCEPAYSRIFFCMDGTTFDILPNKVPPYIEKQNIKF